MYFYFVKQLIIKTKADVEFLLSKKIIHKFIAIFMFDSAFIDDLALSYQVRKNIRRKYFRKIQLFHMRL